HSHDRLPCLPAPRGSEAARPVRVGPVRHVLSIRTRGSPPMPMIGPMPPAPEPPAAPTPWRVDDVFPRRVKDAKGEPLFSVDGPSLTYDQDAALARELVDLVNRAAAVDP